MVVAYTPFRAAQPRTAIIFRLISPSALPSAESKGVLEVANLSTSPQPILSGPPLPQR